MARQAGLSTPSAMVMKLLRAGKVHDFGDLGEALALGADILHQAAVNFQIISPDMLEMLWLRRHAVVLDGNFAANRIECFRHR